MVKELTIVQLNDVHGYLDIHSEIFYENGKTEFRKSGGYARIASLLKTIREQSGEILLFDSGDTFHGTFPVVDTKGDVLVPVLNSLGITAMTGHWDFAYGPRKLKQLMGSLNYPIIAANVYYKDGSGLVFPPYLVSEISGLKIGIIGIACNIVDKTMPASFSEGIKFTTGEAELPEYIKELRDEHGTDLVLLLSHNGFPQDVELVRNNRGIDIVLSGHTHNRLFTPFKVNDTLIIQSGSHGSFAGILRVAVDGGIIRNSVEADVYFSNGWRYGAPIPVGEITLNDLYNIVPMDPAISIKDITGAEIFEMIEENLENTYSANPLKQMGGYAKRTLEMRVYFKVENPFRSRIQYIAAGGKELQKEKVYKAAFITEQGVPVKYGTCLKNTDIHAVEAMKTYLHDKKIANTGMQNSFMLI